MTAPRTLWIDGVALWTPALPGWAAARQALQDDGARGGDPAATADSAAPAAARRPAPSMLAANERRRAPDAVLLALEVASAAVAASGRDAASLASVFASAHGDLPIVDALCRTLATDPLTVSPTRFHHSVHNAASGYWAIGSACMAASTALAAFDHSFAAGLLEAAALCAADDAPVLLVGCDTEAVGALASTNHSRGLLALALVLAPWPGPKSRWRLRWQLQPGAAAPPPPAAAAAAALAGNAMADALPLAQALARTEAAGPAAGAAADRLQEMPLELALGPALHLRLHLQPLPDPTAGAAAGAAA